MKVLASLALRLRRARVDGRDGQRLVLPLCARLPRVGIDTHTPWRAPFLRQTATISIIAEYRRKFAVDSGFAKEMFEPQILSPVFREFGARGIAVLADERIGECSYDDIVAIVKEQESAKGDMPGPVPVTCNDLIVDEVQIARSASVGAQALGIALRCPRVWHAVGPSARRI